MWLFLQRRLRMWLIMAVALPLFVGVLRLIRQRVEAQSGETRLTRGLGSVEGFTRGIRR